MRGDILKAKVLSTKIIPNVSDSLRQQLSLSDEICSIGLITCDSDDATYVALDEATKKADVSVIYSHSFYAGAANASTKLSGEVIGVLAGNTPEDVKSGLSACVKTISSDAHFVSANSDDSIVYFAHCVSRTGSYLSNMAGVKEGEALAYLIAPPLESIYAVDAALKAADVTLCVMFKPPTETNFGGALLTGSQSACATACEVFARSVESVADSPNDIECE